MTWSAAANLRTFGCCDAAALASVGSTEGDSPVMLSHSQPKRRPLCGGELARLVAARSK
jgi:hypothetical protein